MITVTENRIPAFQGIKESKEYIVARNEKRYLRPGVSREEKIVVKKTYFGSGYIKVFYYRFNDNEDWIKFPTIYPNIYKTINEAIRSAKKELI